MMELPTFNLNGVHPEYVRLMLEGAQARFATGMIDLEELNELTKNICPDGYQYVSGDCGCESFMYPANAEEPDRSSFCKHVSK